MKKTQSQKLRIVKRIVKMGYISTPHAISHMLTTKLSTRCGELERDHSVTFERSRIPWGNTFGTKYSLSYDEAKKLGEAFGV
jgi:hypothetical protein